MFCPFCGQAFPERETICPGCGRDIRTFAPPSEAADPDPADRPEDEQTEAALPDGSNPPEGEAPAGDGEVSADGEEAVAAKDGAALPEDQVPADGEDGEEGEPAKDGEAPEDAGDPGEDRDPPAAPPKKKHTAAIVLGAVVGLALIAAVCLAVVLTSMPRRTHYRPDAVAVQVQDTTGQTLTELTNEQLSFYYWGEYYYYVQSNGFSFDAAVPLDEQEYSEGTTWQDFFLDSAKTSIRQTEALKLEAEQAGFVMPEDYQSQYDQVISSLAEYSANAGFTDEDGNGDVLAYVQDSYGPDATLESFEAYLYDSYYVTAYSDTIYYGQTFTDEELAAYYEEHSDTMALYGIEMTDRPNVDVRHILIQPEALDEDATEEEQAEAQAEAEAQRIYEEWQSGEATEDSFAALAEAYSADGGSKENGGLYENVYPGQMVEAFNDWCFDESRKPGDTGIVETDYGYHILYFVRTTDDYYWKSAVEEELRYEAYNDAIQEMVDAYTVVTTDQLAFTLPDAVAKLQDSASQEADSAE